MMQTVILETIKNNKLDLLQKLPIECYKEISNPTELFTEALNADWSTFELLVDRGMKLNSTDSTKVFDKIFNLCYKRPCIMQAFLSSDTFEKNFMYIFDYLMNKICQDKPECDIQKKSVVEIILSDTRMIQFKRYYLVISGLYGSTKIVSECLADTHFDIFGEIKYGSRIYRFDKFLNQLYDLRRDNILHLFYRDSRICNTIWNTGIYTNVYPQLREIIQINRADKLSLETTDLIIRTLLKHDEFDSLTKLINETAQNKGIDCTEIFKNIFNTNSYESAKIKYLLSNPKIKLDFNAILQMIVNDYGHGTYKKYAIEYLLLDSRMSKFDDLKIILASQYGLTDLIKQFATDTRINLFEQVSFQKSETNIIVFPKYCIFTRNIHESVVDILGRDPRLNLNDCLSSAGGVMSDTVKNQLCAIQEELDLKQSVLVSI